jgi:hypothetical protein
MFATPCAPSHAPFRYCPGGHENSHDEDEELLDDDEDEDDECELLLLDDDDLKGYAYRPLSYTEFGAWCCKINNTMRYVQILS